MKIKLHVQYDADRKKIIEGLANSGYPVWIEKEPKKDACFGTDYFVLFEIEEEPNPLYEKIHRQLMEA